MEGYNITHHVKVCVSEERPWVLFLGDLNGYSDLEKVKISLEKNFLLNPMQLTSNKDSSISLDFHVKSERPKKLTVEWGWAPWWHDRTVI